MTWTGRDGRPPAHARARNVSSPPPAHALVRGATDSASSTAKQASPGRIWSMENALSTTRIGSIASDPTCARNTGGSCRSWRCTKKAHRRCSKVCGQVKRDGCWSKASARAVVDNSSCCMGSPAHRRIKVTPVQLCAAAQHPAARNSQTGQIRAAAAVDHEVHALGAHSTRKNSASKLDLAAGNGGQHALEWRWASRVSDPVHNRRDIH